MKYGRHLRSVQDAWGEVNAVVETLSKAVRDLEQARGAFYQPLHTQQRMTSIHTRVEALVRWEQERAVVKSDRRFIRSGIAPVRLREVS